MIHPLHLLRKTAIPLALIALGWGGLAAQPTLPRFEPRPCPFIASGFSPECGDLVVPETRSPADADDTNVIRIAVAIFPARSPNPLPDPVIYLDGGPGGHTLVFADSYMSDFAPWNQKRDVILLDQRGVGFSTPSLDCPNLTELDYDLLDEDVSVEERLRRTQQAFDDCQERLVGEGVALAAYNSTENAADVADLIRTLGYDQANLFGISYGTRLALFVMRDHPEVVRSAVLDAVYPPEVNAYGELVANADRAFDMLFAACAEDAACSAAYPTLEATFYDTVASLNESPRMLSFVDQYSGRNRDVLVNGDLLLGGLFTLLYDTDAIPFLPRAIQAASEGRYSRFLEDVMLNIFFGEFFSEGMYRSVECREELAFSTYESAVAASAGVPAALRDFALPEIEQEYRACAAWAAPSTTLADDQPVVSDIPTLLTVGDFDPITPPAWAERAAASLANSTTLVFPGVGHSAFYGGECPRSIILAFFDAPMSTPDTGCLAEMPQFTAR